MEFKIKLTMSPFPNPSHTTNKRLTTHPNRYGRVQGWESVFWGVYGFLGIQKIQRFYLVIIPRFHADQILIENGLYFLENIFYLVGFTYDFAFCQNNGSPNIEIIPWKKRPLYPSKWRSFRGWVWWVQEKVKFLDFQNVQIWKDNIFPRCFHNFSCIFWNVLVINTGSTGPDLVKILEVPKIIRWLLQYVRGP